MGFGGAAAHLFVREGAKVVLTDIRDELGERAAAALRADGHDARYLHLDVTSERNWAEVVDAVMATHGRLDILFNNAGVSFPRKVEDITVEIWERELGVHAKGVFLGTRTAIPAMRKGGGGSIINTSSVMGIVGSPTSPAYSAAKGAITIFTKSAALQYAKENIRINSVHPGYADTPLTEKPCDDEGRDPEQDRDDPTHRVTAGVHEPAERTDDRAHDDEPYPFHGGLVPRSFDRKPCCQLRRRAAGPVIPRPWKSRRYAISRSTAPANANRNPPPTPSRLATSPPT
jgi:NAD(P)-dependent dehydrogenase (short-subunit alcohol dehydrogenase family)